MNADNRPEPADAEVSVVTATRRLARWLKEEDDRRHVIAGDQAWRPIDVSAWDTWVDATWRRLRDWGSTSVTGTLLSDEQERFLWEQAVADIPAIGAVLMPGQVAREAQAAWKLVTEFGVDRDELAAAGGQATRHLLQAGAFVEERCRDRGWRTRTMRMAQLAGAEGFNHVVTSEVILDSLEEPVPLQRTLLDAIAKTGSRVKHRDRGREGASVVARPCADPQRELESLALAARAWIERNPHARVGIVVQDLEGRRDDVEAIFDDILSPERVLPGRAGQARQWDLSLGKSLSEWPMIATALRALSLCLDEAPYSEMSLLLRAPHIGGVASELADRCRLDAWLRGRGRYEASIERLAPDPHNQRYEGRPACPDLDARLTRIVDQLPGMSGRARPEDWVTRFMALLSLLGWPGFRPLVSAEYQCLTKWQQLLSGVAALGNLSGPVSARQCLDRIRKHASETVFQPEGPIAPIQVLGLHETPGLVFDALWVAGTHHQAWPRPLRPNALIPASLQRGLGMPRSCAEAELVYAREKTRRLASAADFVCFSWPRTIDDEPMRPSPLIAGLPRLVEPRQSSRYDRLVNRTGKLVWASDYCLPPLEPGDMLRGGSAALRDQSACPFRGQARHRLLATSLESPTPGVSPIDSGRIAHLALQWLWEEWGSNERSKTLSEDELHRTVDGAVSRACRLLMAKDDPLARSIRALEQGKISRRIIALLAQDLSRPAFDVAGVEQKGEMELAGVRLRYRVDRVDRLANGGLVLIDYKTGSAQTRAWLGERPEEPQLPLYGLAFGESASGLAFGCLKVGEEQYLGLADHSVTGTEISGVGDLKRPPDGAGGWEELRVLWRRRLERIASEHVKGDAHVAPRRESRDCAYCDLSPLCRRHELRHMGMMPDD
jgi:probable DNA repair protein